MADVHNCLQAGNSVDNFTNISYGINFIALLILPIQILDNVCGLPSAPSTCSLGHIALFFRSFGKVEKQCWTPIGGRVRIGGSNPWLLHCCLRCLLFNILLLLIFSSFSTELAWNAPRWAMELIQLFWSDCNNSLPSMLMFGSGCGGFFFWFTSILFFRREHADEIEKNVPFHRCRSIFYWKFKYKVHNHNIVCLSFIYCPENKELQRFNGNKAGIILNKLG